MPALATQRYPDLKYGQPDYWVKMCEVMREEDVVRLSWLIDMFGGPDEFGERTFSPGWRTSDVLSLAQGIYAERTFDRLPILADALQDAGCADEQVLGHCYGSGPHVRGCWVVDLVLGKE